jgi:hypothetical protein
MSLSDLCAPAQLSAVQDAIDLLKRLEMIGSREKQRRYNSTASHRITNTKATEMGSIRKVVITVGIIAGIRTPRLNT